MPSRNIKKTKLMQYSFINCLMKAGAQGVGAEFLVSHFELHHTWLTGLFDFLILFVLINASRESIVTQVGS